MIQTSAKRQTTRTKSVQRTLIVDDAVVLIPTYVKDLVSFRRWCKSADFPEGVRICYLNDEVWVDMSKEQAYTHNRLKTQFAAILTVLLQTTRLGTYFGDGMRLSNPAANLSCRPDGIFVARKTLLSGKVRRIKGAARGYVELEGTPDMVLEVVSDASVYKDTDLLRELYWLAGIPEYWLVDARGEELLFDVLQHGTKGYTATRKQGGWVKSGVLGKSFRLTCQDDELGDPEYVLAVK